MAELKKVKERWDKFSLNQKILIISLTLAVIGGVIFLAVLTYTGGGEYKVLYSDIDEKEMSKIVDYLEKEKIPYKVESSRILVPSSMVYNVRIKLAGEGLPSSGNVGFELFDENRIGRSDFEKKIDYKRALEGELERTILRMRGVKGVRVHIAMGKESIFSEEEIPPSASVVLDLSGVLTKGQVNAILNLVSSAVEGLIPERITIIDTNMKVWHKMQDPDDAVGMTSNQFEIKQSVEKYLSSKIKQLFDGIARTNVAVDVKMNFDRIKKTVQSYDGINTAVRSEEVITGGQEGEHTITNYEVPQTIEEILQGTGNIERITVSVFIDGKVDTVKKEDGSIEIVKKERSPEEIKSYEDLIKAALGMDTERGDVVSVKCVNFADVNENLPIVTAGIDLSFIPYVVLGLIILIVSLILYSSVKKIVKPEIVYVKEERKKSSEEGDDIDLNSLPIEERVAYIVKEKPEVAARIIKNWMESEK